MDSPLADTVARLKAEIAETEQKLAALYAERRAVFVEMDKTMTRRQIAAVWGISNTAVTLSINGDKYKINW